MKRISSDEEELVRSAQASEAVDFTPPASNNPPQDVRWDANRTIRAEVICALATKSNPAWPVGSRGVRLKGAMVTGRLDFEAATIACPLALINCHIEQQICLKDATAFSIALTGCHVAGGIDGTGLTVDHNVELSGDFVAKHQVTFADAKIKGNLFCDGGQFEDPTAEALFMDRIVVKGSIFLRKGFCAKGEVRLPAASVGGDVECRDGHFEKSNYENDRKSYAFVMDGIDVKGHIFLTEGFTAKGEVRLVEAMIAGQLNCEGGRFENPSSRALNMDSVDVKGLFAMRAGFHAEGGVDLTNARVGVLGDEKEAWPSGGIKLDGFTYGNIHDPLDAKDRLEWLDLRPERFRFHPQPYEQLARVLRQMGYVSVARRILLAKQQRLRQRGKLGTFGRVNALFLELTVGYGYRPWLAGFWLVFLLLLGSWVASRAYEARMMLQSQSVPTWIAYPRFHPVLYSFDRLSLPPLELGQKAYWRPDERQGLEFWFWTFEIYFILHALFAWVLTGLLIAALTGIIKKE